MHPQDEHHLRCVFGFQDITEYQRKRCVAVRTACFEAAKAIWSNVPVGAARDGAIAALKACVNEAIAGIIS